MLYNSWKIREAVGVVEREIEREGMRMGDMMFVS